MRRDFVPTLSSRHLLSCYGRGFHVRTPFDFLHSTVWSAAIRPASTATAAVASGVPPTMEHAGEMEVTVHRSGMSQPWGVVVEHSLDARMPPSGTPLFHSLMNAVTSALPGPPASPLRAAWVEGQFPGNYRLAAIDGRPCGSVDDVLALRTAKKPTLTLKFARIPGAAAPVPAGDDTAADPVDDDPIPSTSDLTATTRVPDASSSLCEGRRTLLASSSVGKVGPATAGREPVGTWRLPTRLVLILKRASADQKWGVSASDAIRIGLLRNGLFRDALLGCKPVRRAASAAGRVPEDLIASRIVGCYRLATVNGVDCHERADWQSHVGASVLGTVSLTLLRLDADPKAYRDDKPSTPRDTALDAFDVAMTRKSSADAWGITLDRQLGCQRTPSTGGAFGEGLLRATGVTSLPADYRVRAVNGVPYHTVSDLSRALSNAGLSATITLQRRPVTANTGAVERPPVGSVFSPAPPVQRDATAAAAPELPNDRPATTDGRIEVSPNDTRDQHGCHKPSTSTLAACHNQTVFQLMCDLPLGERLVVGRVRVPDSSPSALEGRFRLVFRMTEQTDLFSVAIERIQ